VEHDGSVPHLTSALGSGIALDLPIATYALGHTNLVTNGTISALRIHHNRPLGRFRSNTVGCLVHGKEISVRVNHDSKGSFLFCDEDSPEKGLAGGWWLVEDDGSVPHLTSALGSGIALDLPIATYALGHTNLVTNGTSALRILLAAFVPTL
jgi:hypothetical protein